MNQIQTQAARARRRLILARFGRFFCWTLFASLLLATLAIAVPAIWVMEVNYQQWVIGWLTGAVSLAVITAIACAYWNAPTLDQAAQELDRRFGLRERLSSSLAMKAEQRESDFGAALATDAEKRASQLSVADRFSLKPTRLGWLPVSIVPVLAVVLLLVDPATRTNASSVADQPSAAEIDQVQTVVKQLKKSLEQQRRKAESEGLEDAKEMFERMEADLKKIADRKQMSKKEALIALNDIKKQLEERRNQLGTPDQMRRAMAQMKGLDAGPADTVAKALEKGEFGEAKKVVQDLAKKIRNGNLTAKQKDQLKKQMDQMRQQLDKAVQQHEQKKQELQDQIDQAKREGRAGDAAQMQQKLNELKQQDGQMQNMQQMAEAMAQAAQAMQQGDASQAADAMEAMADQLGQMADEMSELQDLESAMDDLLQSKQQMGCQQCQGAGCEACQGGGGDGFGSGNGLGKGQGQGDRPESETDTNFYDSQVRGKVKRGRAIIAGFADGPNRKGVTREDLKSVIESELSEDANPLENQNLPRAEREHAQQYFDSLREGR